VALLEPIAVTLSVVTVFERMGIEYVVGGSLATSLHGVPRATLDVDLVADLRMGHLDEFVTALEGDFFVDKDMVKDAIRRRASFNVLHMATMFKVDVFVVGADELLAAEMARKLRVCVQTDPPASVYVATAEDMILQKLLWFRAGGGVSDRQWNDILGVIATQSTRLDRDYLRLWSDRKRITDLLERALAGS
jgi:hypothetical protein